MTVLVTGGAGYIGSHAVLALLDRGEKVVVLDDLSSGYRSLVPPGATFVEGSVGNAPLTAAVLKDHRIDVAMHFAGSLVVSESVSNPLLYYDNNTAASRTLLESCIAQGVKKFVFSSSSAVYGIAPSPITEEAVLNPINPYGRSKMMTEWMLEDAAKANGLNYVTLRYFNVAGADAKGRAGEIGGTSHIVKRAAMAALGAIDKLEVFGTDYPTPDGTCVRDYIHVSDLADAHVLALDYLDRGESPLVLNCGYGHGYSVREVIDTMAAECGNKLPVALGARRAGDPAVLVADATRLKHVLEWTPRHDDLKLIVSSALDWERRLDGVAH